jgi:adenylate kinase family enzyme
MSDDEGLPTLEEIDQFMRATVRADAMHDQTVSMLEDRITDLEEIVWARWPRTFFAARRLRRKIKASIRGVPGATFAHRRVDAVSYELAVQKQPGGGRQGGES